MPSAVLDMWLAAATWWRLQQEKKVEPGTPADTRHSHLAKVFRCSATARDLSEGEKMTVKIMPPHHRITKQATWEAEPWEYRTLDLGNIRLICLLFCICVSNFCNNNTSIFKNILWSYFSISLLRNVDFVFQKSNTGIHERKSNKWSSVESVTIGREAMAQPGGHVTHGRTTIHVLFGDFSQREGRLFF